ncbi:hypothetical protein ATZ35_01170 [Enterococcus rotai]|uniref:DUF5626 domain-containing protein n=1 Tax=Enterococcus rotai TaxID=118060 RepID=A0A0U2WQK0_9ENTE|nr:hypothetical protein [Enterococcus rotai]ALS35817.1 hypothetical protein ATZ35_01170 [Enterococcus rotai]
MKKCVLFVTLSLGLLFVGSTVVSAEEFAPLPSVQSVDLGSLSDEAIEHFESEGFSENDEYYTETIVQTPPKSNGVQARAVNVITLTAGTKKVDNTTGYTSYIITATQAPFTKINMKLNVGSVKSFTSNITPYKGTYGYSGGIYSFYSGKRGYQGYRLQAQYTTTWGSGSTSCSAGGMTIGK